MNTTEITTRPLSFADREKLRQFARGQLTAAELENWTWEDALALAQFGCRLASDGKLAEACTVFEGMAAFNPKDAAARAALGTVYQKLERTDAALAEYDAALELEPRHPVALANRGELRLRRGDPDGANDLVAAIAADPNRETPASRRALAIVKAMAMGAVHA